jgi:hypothetical protein
MLAQKRYGRAYRRGSLPKLLNTEWAAAEWDKVCVAELDPRALKNQTLEQWDRSLKCVSAKVEKTACYEHGDISVRWRVHLGSTEYASGPADSVEQAKKIVDAVVGACCIVHKGSTR